MFDMQKIGRQISSLRKKKGMTQMELADALGISYQAVSNWERGNTMPDISKLPELAEIFGVSIEEILCDERKGKIAEEMSEGKTPEMTKEELADFAPILPQEQFQKNFEENQSREPWNLSDLFALAPFMEEEDVGRLALKFADSGHAPSEFVGLAPFMDEKSLGEIVNRLTENGHAPSEFAGLVPFMDEESFGKIVDRLSGRGYAPSEFVALAPFMREEDLERLVRDYLAGGGSFAGLASVAPFLGEGAIKNLFKGFGKE